MLKMAIITVGMSIRDCFPEITTAPVIAPMAAAVIPSTKALILFFIYKILYQPRASNSIYFGFFSGYPPHSIKI